MLALVGDPLGLCLGDSTHPHCGQLPGKVVCPPFEPHDLLELGLNEGGGVYVTRNGELIVTDNGYWPAEDSFPTVTFHSGGTEVLIDVRNVARKRPHRLDVNSWGLKLDKKYCIICYVVPFSDFGLHFGFMFLLLVPCLFHVGSIFLLLVSCFPKKCIGALGQKLSNMIEK